MTAPAEPVIRLQNASLSIPLHGVETQSLKKTLLGIGAAGRFGTNKQSGLTQIEALDDVSLDVFPGDRIGVIGRNGSGKSTLLRLLAGIYEPTTGFARIRGKVAPLLDIGLGIDDDLSGRENIALRATLLGLSPERIAEIEDEVIAFTELGPYIDLPVRTYSSGMRMRVAFAVSTCVEPDVLLLDEWIATGDASFVRRAEERLNELISRIKVLVLASHAPGVIQHTCNLVLVLHQGRRVFFGPVEEGLQFYAGMP